MRQLYIVKASFTIYTTFHHIAEYKKEIANIMISLSIFTIYGLIALANAFPDGAPADTCVKQRANEPNHGASRTQAIHTLPYEVRAESDTYHPGQQIKGSDLVYWKLYI